MKYAPDKIKDELIVNRITRVLVDRDGFTPNEASDEFKIALEAFSGLMDEDGASYPYDFCQTWFGLEEDYLDEMIEASL